jgi:hypothetical protein
MPSDDRDLLEVLKFELQFLEKGGYGRSPRQSWRAPLIFEDSPSCLNFALPQKIYPCSDCVLMQLVPEGDREKSVPCDHIVLNEAGETVASLYHTADQAEIEEVLKDWLHKTIRNMEEAGQTAPDATGPQAPVNSLGTAKCANPLCPTRFDPQDQGRFFVLRQWEGEPENLHHVKHYWLCHRCSEVFTLIEQPGRGPTMAVRRQDPH